MEDVKGATTMTWEELEDCGVSLKELQAYVSRNLLFPYPTTYYRPLCGFDGSTKHRKGPEGPSAITAEHTNMFFMIQLSFDLLLSG